MFDGSLYHSADWDLWIRLAKGGPPAWVPKPLVGYRIHPGSASLDLEGMFAESYEIERRYGGHVDRTRAQPLPGEVRQARWLAEESPRVLLARGYRGESRYITREFLPDISTLLFDMLRPRADRVGVRVKPGSAGT